MFDSSANFLTKNNFRHQVAPKNRTCGVERGVIPTWGIFYQSHSQWARMDQAVSGLTGCPEQPCSRPTHEYSMKHVHPNAAVLLHCILSGVCFQTCACLPFKATLTPNSPFLSSSYSLLTCLFFHSSPHLGVFLPPYTWAGQGLTEDREMSLLPA